MKLEVVRTKSHVGKNIPVAEPKRVFSDADIVRLTPGWLRAGTKLMFRAECELDAQLFMGVIPEFIHQPWSTVVEYGEPEVTFRLKKRMSLDDLRWVASMIPDAHVIFETLAPAKVYTGERTFQGPDDNTQHSLTPKPAVISRLVLYARNYARFTTVLAGAAKNMRKDFDKCYVASGYPERLLKP